MKIVARILPLLLTLVSAHAVSDDVSGSRNLLCSTLEAHVCEFGGCTELDIYDLNMPQFITVDTKTKTLATTAASGENRQTTAATLTRENGQLLLQGFENNRAFSLLIHEASGEAFFASAGLGMTVTAFGACTPAPGK